MKDAGDQPRRVQRSRSGPAWSGASSGAPRKMTDLVRDDSGQLLTEWVLVTTFVVLPLGATAPWMLQMIDAYFYRITGAITLPFP